MATAQSAPHIRPFFLVFNANKDTKKGLIKGAGLFGPPSFVRAVLESKLSKLLRQNPELEQLR
jgi:hypothetical protein